MNNLYNIVISFIAIVFSTTDQTLLLNNYLTNDYKIDKFWKLKESFSVFIDNLEEFKTLKEYFISQTKKIDIKHKGDLEYIQDSVKDLNKIMKKIEMCISSINSVLILRPIVNIYDVNIFDFLWNRFVEKLILSTKTIKELSSKDLFNICANFNEENQLKNLSYFIRTLEKKLDEFVILYLYYDSLINLLNEIKKEENKRIFLYRKNLLEILRKEIEDLIYKINQEILKNEIKFTGEISHYTINFGDKLISNDNLRYLVFNLYYKFLHMIYLTNSLFVSGADVVLYKLNEYENNAFASLENKFIKFGKTDEMFAMESFLNYLLFKHQEDATHVKLRRNICVSNTYKKVEILFQNFHDKLQFYKDSSLNLIHLEGLKLSIIEGFFDFKEIYIKNIEFFCFKKYVMTDEFVYDYLMKLIDIFKTKKRISTKKINKLKYKILNFKPNNK